jgi:uncharacterized delta-60 repeat protein
MSAPRLTVATALVVLAGLLAAGAANATVPGELDPSFGIGGKVQTPFGPESYAGGVAVQSDGKILVVGTPEASEGFSVARLLSNGSPDPSWGEGGVVTTPLGKFASAFDVLVQPDGKIVVVGEAPGSKNEDFAIVRYLSNGKLDPGFGEGGIVILPVGTEGDQGRVVAIGPGGRIAVVGISDLPSFRNAVGVAMLESNGNPEAAFAGDGTTLVQTESGEDDRGEGVDFQSDGKIVIADSTGAGIGDGFTLIRLGLDGKPDPSFGGDGIVETPIPGEGGVEEGRISDVLVQPDGKIVGGGYGVDSVGAAMETVIKFEVIRYLSNGELDPSFGSGGRVGQRLPSPYSFGRKLALDAKGRLILGGTYDANPAPLEEDEAPALMRFNPNGSLDPSFGSGGIVVGKLGAGIEEESIEGLALQPDGKIVASGSLYAEPGGGSGVVSRYIADFPAPPAPPKKTDRGPHSKIKGLHRNVHQKALKGFHGTATDPDGSVAKVQISLVRLTQRRLSILMPIKPRRWRTAKGTTKWSYRLPHKLAPGSYVVFSRAIDDQGLAERVFRKRDHNQVSFGVLPNSR